MNCLVRSLHDGLSGDKDHRRDAVGAMGRASWYGAVSGQFSTTLDNQELKRGLVLTNPRGSISAQCRAVIADSH